MWNGFDPQRRRPTGASFIGTANTGKSCKVQTIRFGGEAVRVYRLEPKTGAKQYPVTDRQGRFILGDPAKGGEKHHAANAVHAASEQEMIDLIRCGFSVRVETATAPSLVRRNLYVDGVKVT